MSVERSPSGHIIPKEKAAYNDRLFRKGWRRYLHEARYHWLNKKMRELKLVRPSVLELGCFDAKTIDYLPFGFNRYVGYDANWENGLEIGRQRWKGNPGVTLIGSQEPGSFNPGRELFDCSISLETLEHLPAAQLDRYLETLAASTRSYCFISVPYEQGLPLLLKYSYKSLLRNVDEPYTFRELLAGSMGNTSKVERVEGGHKGFDYRQLICQLQQGFEVLETTPLPFRWLPQRFNFSVGIVARPKRNPLL